MKHYEVVAGIIEYDNKILCMERNKGKFDYVSFKFEFPGGKIETGETQQEALKRELMEELEMDAEVNDFFLTVTHQYPDFEITMHSYKCSVKTPEFVMKEHKSFVWLERKDLNKLDWAPADKPIVNKLICNEL